MSGKIVGKCSILKSVSLRRLFKFFRLMIVLYPADLCGLMKILDKDWDLVGVAEVMAPL